MRYDRLIERICRGAVLDESGARRALEATLPALGERLLDLDARFAADALPAPLGDLLRRRERPGAFDLAELYRRVGEREGVGPELGVEHARAVLQALAEELDEGPARLLRSRLPDDFAALLSPRPHPHWGESARLSEPRPGTLASGRPGSGRPLSESSADRVQSQSVAAADNPHAATKLSSAQGISSEREGRTLATGKPPR